VRQEGDRKEVGPYLSAEVAMTFRLSQHEGERLSAGGAAGGGEAGNGLPGVEDRSGG